MSAIPDPLALISLTKGCFAIIDAGDYDRVSKHRWWDMVDKGDKLYAGTWIQLGEAMHRTSRVRALTNL